MEATVAERGQITLPKAVRDALGLTKGTLLKVELDGSRIILRKSVDDAISRARGKFALDGFESSDAAGAAGIVTSILCGGVFCCGMAIVAIILYIWIRFGHLGHGLAAVVALVHDVSITLGLVGLSQLVFNTVLGKALLIDAFRMDLPMIAALLTVIGYSLNDTIVVFDRIRENKGRVESLNPRIINMSINQTLARTLLTSFTTFLVVGVLYVVGGKGVHGFSFALLIGVIVGTYSSIGIATPLLYRTKLLHSVVTVIAALAVIGIVFAVFEHQTTRLVLVGLALVACIVALMRLQRGPGYVPAGRPVGA